MPLTRIRLRPAVPVAPARTTASSSDVAAEATFDAGEVRAPADQLAVRRGPVASAPREQHDRLEQAGLAGRVGPPDELRPGAERGIERGVPAQVAQADGVEQVPPQEVVRTGITTCT